MKKNIPFCAILLVICIQLAKANSPIHGSLKMAENPEDSARLAELDQYWAMLAQTVKEGDFEGYGALYHQNAVVVFAGGDHKTSMPIEKALSNWEKGFNNTKAGKQNDHVEFRFAQRIGDDNTAFETGIFFFSSTDANGKTKTKSFTHFEMLLIRKDDGWYALMEHQKSKATPEEWDALKH